MSEQNATQAAWLEEETARRYQIFAQKTSMYQELSQAMVELAQLQPDQRVLDLGCGTGVTTRAALAALGPAGHVYGLDLSGPMLAIAGQEIPDSRVTFLRGDAAEAATLLAGQPPVDRILCNSVFWQFRHKPAVLAALRRVLAPNGLFVFNAPEPYFILKDIPRSAKVSVLFKQLAAERYGVGQQDLRTMPAFLQRHGFEVVTHKIITRTRPGQENYLFFKLPVATAWMEPPLDYETRMALLEEAHQLAQPDQTVQQRWIYYVVRPTPQDA